MQGSQGSHEKARMLYRPGLYSLLMGLLMCTVPPGRLCRINGSESAEVALPVF